jgi:hypothetical protein
MVDDVASIIEPGPDKYYPPRHGMPLKARVEVSNACFDDVARD